MNKTSENSLTPLMQQYYEIKQQYQEMLLLFQVGDFYELFFDDAKVAAQFLGIALTKRGHINGEPIPLCGVPVHAKEHYITKLVRGGFKVAIAEQLEEPRPGTVVRRGVTQVLTPGTLTDDKLLDAKSASYLLSFFPLEHEWALVFGELLTAQLFATTLSAATEKSIESELIRFFPDEILVPSGMIAKEFTPFFKKRGYFITQVEAQEHADATQTWLAHQFDKQLQHKLAQHQSLALALQTFYAYLQKNQQAALAQFSMIQWYHSDDFVLIDAATQRNLELIKNNQDGSRKNSLFAVLDRAITPMGSRMIKKWLLRPLVKKVAIEQRQQVLELLINNPSLTQQLEQLLTQIGDLERVIGRITLYRATLHDYCALYTSLVVVPELKQLVYNHAQTIPLLAVIISHMADFTALTQLLAASLNTDLGLLWIIKPGFDQKLDHLRELVEHGNTKIIELEQREQQKTGIGSLKVRYNKIHGYYIELTNTHTKVIPDYYIRQQMLAGRQRFTTVELQQLQQELFTARNEIDQVEKEIFERIKGEIVPYNTHLRKLAHALAHVDGLLSFARLAYSSGYIKPTLNTNRMICIEDGRHPVVELAQDAAFIPNDTQLIDEASTWIITGPNMGGKSTYLRQVAHIAIMAHIGSFVPAKKADIALIDRVFTRIGASDNVAEGKSTFLIEMEETAAICSYATENSLVILDEVGRGTSTFDGLAIAQAVVEYIHTVIKARCLFATHYHELTELQEQIPGIISYFAASKKTEQGIIFLYKIMRGVADGSFGVEVAKLAQLPPSVIGRSEAILQQLHHENNMGAVLQKIQPAIVDPEITKLAEENRRLKELVKIMGEIDYDNLSPKKAFDLLWELKTNY